MQYYIEEKSIDSINLDKLIFKKKKLIETIKNLSKLEYLEIFSIIQNDNCQFSENKNGIFINLSNVSEITIDKIFNFINFIKHKKEDLIKHEEIINNAKKNISENDSTIYNLDLNNYTDNCSNDYMIDSDNEKKIESDYLIFSSDEDEDLENKISLKKKKTKYSGKKAKMIKSIRDSSDINKFKNKSKKNDD